MRTQYLLDDVRRRTGDAVRRFLAREAQDRQVRRRRWVTLAAGGVGVVGVAWGVWATWLWAFPPAPQAGRVAEAEVPEHQRTGPLANPWGSGPPALGERAPDVATPAAASGASGASGAQDGSAAQPAFTWASPAAREAVLAALRQMRGSAKTADFVKRALESRDPATLTAAWMAERQCRHVTQWRLMFDWRTRTLNPGASADVNAPLPSTGVHPQLRTLLARCGEMPGDLELDAALAAVGFAATGETAESTRRPLNLASAVSIGDPVLLATVVDATSDHELSAFLAQRTRPGTPPETAAEVLKAALWLASCRAGAGAGAARANHPACAEHPALWQACTQQGLCDARDLHDLLLRTLPNDQWHASERLAAELVSLIGR